MAEKTDQEIINELSLETSMDSNDNTSLEELSIDLQEEGLEPIDNAPEASQPNENIEDTTSNEQARGEEKDDQQGIEEEPTIVEDAVEEDVPVQKKQPKAFRILIGVLIFLALSLIIGLILFFTGFFDPEEEAKPNMETKEKVVQEEEKKDNLFINIKEIDKNRLNKKLQMLTKTEIMNKEELEAQERKIKEEEEKKKIAEQKALEEKKRLEEEKEAAKRAEIQKEIDQLKQHQEDVKKQQEEFLRLQEEAKKELEQQRAQALKELEEGKNIISSIQKEEKKELNEDEIKDEPTNEMKPSEETQNNKSTFLQFINVATIKGNLFKSYLDKVQTIDTKLSLCRDNKNRIEIIFGPYDSEKNREKVLNNLLEKGFKESYLVDFTKEEFDKRCKY